MWPRAIAQFHQAAKILLVFSSKGCPLEIQNNWSKEHILTAIKRGPHKSTMSKEATKALEEETKEKINTYYDKIVLWKDIKNKMPTNMKISPVAMIPHKSRLFRCILDLTFKLSIDNIKQ